jgi:hypothetical protein
MIIRSYKVAHMVAEVAQGGGSADVLLKLYLICEFI